MKACVLCNYTLIHSGITRVIADRDRYTLWCPIDISHGKMMNGKAGSRTHFHAEAHSRQWVIVQCTCDWLAVTGSGVENPETESGFQMKDQLWQWCLFWAANSRGGKFVWDLPSLVWEIAFVVVSWLWLHMEVDFFPCWAIGPLDLFHSFSIFSFLKTLLHDFIAVWTKCQ